MNETTKVAFAAIFFFLSAMFLIIFKNGAAAIAITNSSCIDDSILETNTTINTTVGSDTTSITTSERAICQWGCTSGKCQGTNLDADTQPMWLVFAFGTVFLTLGTILGLPYGKMAGKETFGTFDTTIVVKYIFFFVGLFLIFLSASMARRIGTVYGGESNVIDAVDSVSTLSAWITILFLFIFVIEILFYVIMTIKKNAEKQKWGGRESE